MLDVHDTRPVRVDGHRPCAHATRRHQQTYHAYDQQWEWENDLLSKCIRCGESGERIEIPV